MVDKASECNDGLAPLIHEFVTKALAIQLAPPPPQDWFDSLGRRYSPVSPPLFYDNGPPSLPVWLDGVWYGLTVLPPSPSAPASSPSPPPDGCCPSPPLDPPSRPALSTADVRRHCPEAEVEAVLRLQARWRSVRARREHRSTTAAETALLRAEPEKLRAARQQTCGESSDGGAVRGPLTRLWSGMDIAGSQDAAIDFDGVRDGSLVPIRPTAISDAADWLGQRGTQQARILALLLQMHRGSRLARCWASAVLNELEAGSAESSLIKAFRLALQAQAAPPVEGSRELVLAHGGNMPGGMPKRGRGGPAKAAGAGPSADGDTPMPEADAHASSEPPVSPSLTRKTITTTPAGSAADDASASEEGEEEGEEEEPDDFELGRRMHGRGEKPSPASAKSRVGEGYKAAEALAEAAAVLERLEGLDEVKKQVRDILCVSIDRLQFGDASIKIGSEGSPNYNCIVLGNSGVGKSTLAENVLYPALKKIGVLTGKLVKVSKEDLKGKGYAAKQKEAKFGMLLVDEAYALTGCESVTNEFVNKIHKERSSVMMVVVGYQQEMSIWLRSNQGLQARFEHTIVISDYSAEELVCIGTRYCGAQGFELTGDGVDSALKEAVGVVVDLPPGTSPANADAIERVIRSATNNFRSRRQQSGRANSMAQELTAADIKAGVTKLLSDRHAVGSSSTASGAGSSGGAHSTVRSSAFRTPAAHVRSLTANP